MMDVRDVGPTLAERLGSVTLPGPGNSYFSSPDELPDLPAGFPSSLCGEAIWTRAHFDNKTRFIHSLTASDLTELCQALAHFKGIVVASQLLPHA